MATPRSLRGARRTALALAFPFLLLVSGCGEDMSDTKAEDPTPEAGGLVATLPDGSRIDLDPTEVECVPSEEDPDVEVVRVFADLDGARLLIQAVPTEDTTSFDLPVDAGDYESGAKNVLVFIAAQPEIETSSTEEESSGTLELVRSSCDPAALELKIDATLGSEFSDGGTVQVEGHLALTGAAD